jgi:hypothetical protein
MWLGLAVRVSGSSPVKGAKRTRGGKGVMAVTFLFLFRTEEAVRWAGTLFPVMVLGVGTAECMLKRLVGSSTVWADHQRGQAIAAFNGVSQPEAAGALGEGRLVFKCADCHKRAKHRNCVAGFSNGIKDLMLGIIKSDNNA